MESLLLKKGILIMTNNKTFIEKEPAAIATIVSRKNNLSYEILLISYVEDDEEKHQDLLFYFENACYMAKSDNNKLGTFAYKNVMSVYSGKEPCAIITMTDSKDIPLYKMILVSHAKNAYAIEKHQERFGMTSFITSRFSDDSYCKEPDTLIINDNTENNYITSETIRVYRKSGEE